MIIKTLNEIVLLFTKVDLNISLGKRVVLHFEYLIYNLINILDKNNNINIKILK